MNKQNVVIILFSIAVVLIAVGITLFFVLKGHKKSDPIKPIGPIKPVSSYSWLVSPNVDDTCCGGKIDRQVVCVDSKKTVVSDNFCQDIPKPSDSPVDCPKECYFKPGFWYGYNPGYYVECNIVQDGAYITLNNIKITGKYTYNSLESSNRIPLYMFLQGYPAQFSPPAVLTVVKQQNDRYLSCHIRTDDFDIDFDINTDK